MKIAVLAGQVVNFAFPFTPCLILTSASQACSAVIPFSCSGRQKCLKYDVINVWEPLSLGGYALCALLLLWCFQPCAVCLMELLFCSYGAGLVSKHFCECLRPVGHIGYLWQPQQGQEHGVFLATFEDTIKGDVALKTKRLLHSSAPHFLCVGTCVMVSWGDYEMLSILECIRMFLCSLLNANTLLFSDINNLVSDDLQFPASVLSNLAKVQHFGFGSNTEEGCSNI